MSRQRPSEAGFTLVELLIVVLIIGIVAGICMIAYLNALDRAKQRSTMADMRSISRALEAYLVDNHTVPDASGGITSLTAMLIDWNTRKPVASRAFAQREATQTVDAAGAVAAADRAVARLLDELVPWVEGAAAPPRRVVSPVGRTGAR